MKKIVLTLVAMMAVTFSFAKSSADKRFDMSCDIYRLSVTLDLDEDHLGLNICGSHCSGTLLTDASAN